jgi:glycerol-3-phosphate acyltransferase PlsY
MVIAAYLIGSIPVGVMVGRMRGFDPRAVGSGNIGMTNVARAGGSGAAALTFAGDVLKGAVPVAAARALGFLPSELAWIALAAFAGSIFSIFLRFRGGKGVSAALGVWVILAPSALLFAMAAFAIVLVSFRFMSLASIAAALVIPIAVAALGGPRPYLVLALAISALVLVRHSENIQRMLGGTERRLGERRHDDAAMQNE